MNWQLIIGIIQKHQLSKIPDGVSKVLYETFTSRNAVEPGFLSIVGWYLLYTGYLGYWDTILVSVTLSCPLLGGVRYRGVSVSGRCPLLAGVRYWQVSVTGRCLLFGDDRYRKPFSITVKGSRPVLESVCYLEVLLLENEHNWEVSRTGRCPLTGGISKLTVAFSKYHLRQSIILKSVKPCLHYTN